MKHPDLARYIYENSEQAAIRIVNLEREVTFLRKDVYFRAPSASNGDDGLMWRDAYRELEGENASLRIQRNRYKAALEDVAENINLWCKSWGEASFNKEAKP